MATNNKRLNGSVPERRAATKSRERRNAKDDRRLDAPAEVRMHELSLIAFKGHLYPSATEDYEYLRQRGVTTYRLPLSSLPLLKRTRLTKAKVVLLPFMEMWKPFMEHLGSELEKFGPTKLVTAHSLMTMVPTDNVTKLRSYLNKVSLFSRRYCIALTTDTKNRASDNMSLCKMQFIYNEDINNSYAFMGRGTAGEHEDPFVEIPLAGSVKLRLTRATIGTVPTFQVTVLDKLGENWSEALNRSGKASTISKQAFLDASMFLLEMA